MIQFYIPDPETNVLDSVESSHCVRVLRRKEGDEIYVTDGCGHRYLCVITDANPRGVMFRIESREDVPRHWKQKIVLCVAPSKNIDRMEWLVEKAVEIGVDRIIMMGCERSERKVVKLERLQKIAVSAMNQSLKTTLPIVEGMVPFQDIMKEYRDADCKVFGYCDENTPKRDFTEVYRPDDKEVVILIGPEGDFSPKEVKLAEESGFMPVTFGPTRLRTETAALYGLQSVHLLNTIHYNKLEL